MSAGTGGPVEGCESCEGHTLKIDGKCVLHYVAATHNENEFKQAMAEVSRGETQ